MAILKYLIPKQYILAVLPMVAFWCGTYFDRQETLRLSHFRDKSALYGRELKEGEAPSWP